MDVNVEEKHVLDPCCGSRMMWFDRGHPEVLFGDKRRETLTVTDMRSQAQIALDAATEYAKAEAVRVCENIEAEAEVVQKITGSKHSDGVRCGAASCIAAIKEAL